MFSQKSSAPWSVRLRDHSVGQISFQFRFKLNTVLRNVEFYLVKIKENVSEKFSSHKKDPIQDLEFDKIENAPKKNPDKWSYFIKFSLNEKTLKRKSFQVWED